MKKHIFFILLIVFFPYIFCMLGSLFTDKLRPSQGDSRIEHNHLGKDVLIEINGLYKTMDVEEYVLGVLPGTISADYDIEALKVQAILIRTNVLKEMEEKGSSDASDLSYQYLSVEERKELFGKRNYKKYSDKFERAVVGTCGTVLRQENSLIMAMYHEVSIGKTASAKEIIGEDIAYLQSVESSQDVEAKHYMNVVSYTWAELQELHKQENVVETNKDKMKHEIKEEASSEEADITEPEIDNEEATTEQQTVIQDIQVTEASKNGFVKQLSVDGTVYTGEEAMEKYALCSTNFYVENTEDGIRFVCLGKGNCLGLSQYGANWMAIEGSNFEEIIRYYYQKISIEQFKQSLFYCYYILHKKQMMI